MKQRSYVQTLVVQRMKAATEYQFELGSTEFWLMTSLRFAILTIQQVMFRTNGLDF